MKFEPFKFEVPLNIKPPPSTALFYKILVFLKRKSLFSILANTPPPKFLAELLKIRHSYIIPFKLENDIPVPLKPLFKAKTEAFKVNSF